MGLINNMRARAREDAAVIARAQAERAKTTTERKNHKTYAKICERQAAVLRRAGKGK